MQEKNFYKYKLILPLLMLRFLWRIKPWLKSNTVFGMLAT